MKTYAQAFELSFTTPSNAAGARRGWQRRLCPPMFTDELLPSGPSWEDVQRLLASTEGEKPRDIRDQPS